MEVNHFFSTPVFIMTDNNHGSNLDKLLEEIYDWRKADEENVVRSNNGGWHSPTDIFKKTSPGLMHVCNTMIKCFSAATKQVAPEFKPDDHNMKGEGWVNINPQHGFNVPHDHPGYTWSGVYYVKLPEREDKSRSGCIELLDPRTNTAAMATDISRSSLYFSPKRTLYPKPGMILVFPSYLRHWVYPNEEENDRISMAFNFKYSPKPEEKAKVKDNKSKGPKKSRKRK